MQTLHILLERKGIKMSKNSRSEAYAAAGVNIEAGYEGVKLMKKHVQRTIIPGVVSDLGGFGGSLAPDLTLSLIHI